MFLWFSGKVLVHCHVGVSRSATLVLAYLMLKQNLSLVEAICAVKDNRGVIPNRGFLRQLIKLDGQLFGPHWTLPDSITGQISWVQNMRMINIARVYSIMLNRLDALISLYGCIWFFFTFSTFDIIFQKKLTASYPVRDNVLITNFKVKIFIFCQFVCVKWIEVLH